jgi:ssDNA-binding replication factor A large subunit
MVELEEEEEDKEWQKKLKTTIMKVAGLTSEQAKICMKHIKKTFKERVGEEHRWAPMVKKTSIGSIPIINWWQKTSIRLMVIRRKKIFSRAMELL